MPLEAPNLDNRRYAQIVEEARALIPNYLPEWTDHNASDPGMTLVQLFAWMSEMILFRLNQVPERNYIKFLQMIGVERRPAAPARAEITFNLTSPNLQTVIVPRGTRVEASAPAPPPSAMAAPMLEPDEEDEPPVFETDEPLIAIGAPLAHIVVFDGANYLERTNANNTAGQSFLPFGRRLRANAALYLGFTSSNPFPGDEMNLAFRVHVDPNRIPARECTAASAPQAPATIAWEYWDGGRWRALNVLRDDTVAFTRSGHLYFRGPAKAQRSTIGPVSELAYWLRCRLVTFQYEVPPELDAVLTNTVSATALSTVRDEVIGSSDGSPGQVFTLGNGFISAGSPREALERLRTAPKQRPTEVQQAQLDEQLIAREVARGFLLQVDEGRGFEPWEEVENFYDSGPEDRHYVLNRTTGDVTFGDRERGAIPVAGVNNILVRLYRHGGGSHGNVGTGTITKLQSSVTGVDSATNHWPAEGGQDEESIEDTRVRAPQELKARDRAVTLEDYEFLARATPGVRIRRAHAIAQYHPSYAEVTMPGAVTVIVIPESDDPKPLPSESTMKSVCAWLDARRLLTAELFIAPPKYKLIRINARVQVRASANAAQVKARIEEALTRYLHPLTGGEDGQGWPMGGTVRFADLFRIVFGVEGVATVDDLRIIIDGERLRPCENADVPKDYLVYSDGHDISVSAERTDG